MNVQLAVIFIVPLDALLTPDPPLAWIPPVKAQDAVIFTDPVELLESP